MRILPHVTCTWLMSVVPVLTFLCQTVLCDDFYELLGVSKDATNKEIRKGFKAIALKMHPDKNPDDPKAHDNFLRINRAYEVLKDEDLRKKYDIHGEDGLKEDGPSGRGYKSWNFYHSDFGIYDDDPEIVTLSGRDFEQLVQNTKDLWFINFYSPQCSHCHELAPTWREVARELEGVVRIGAINCGDDWMLCQRQGIRSYPSLLMYPQREKYQGQRTTKELIKYSLQHVRAPVIELWAGNFKSELEDEERAELPWLISFCGDGGDCLERSSTQKLAAMLKDLANVAVVDCHTKETLCEDLGVESGSYYYEKKKVQKDKGMKIESLDSKEVMFAVLGQLPELRSLDEREFTAIIENKQENPWLIQFVEGEVKDLDLRKLPTVLQQSTDVGRVDCTQMRDLCNDLHIHTFPVFALFKSGGGHEFYHGREVVPDLAAFAVDSAMGFLNVLSPKDFPDRVVDTKDPWFVDFYAPWCPPCLRLLPEFRKTSKRMGGKINFGTVDCTIHQGLCNQYQVKSYPTTLFFNQSVPHKYQGHHSMNSMIEFIEDTLKPPVVILDDGLFTSEVVNKPKDTIWLVDFFAPWCGPCQQLAPEWRRLAKIVTKVANLRVGQVDCDAQKSLCSRQGVRSYPTIRLYPANSVNAQNYHVFNGWFRDAQSIRAWAFEYLPSAVKTLNYQSFNQKIALGGSEPWIVDFYAPWCGHCQVFAPEFERIAQTMEGVVNAGKVDCESNQQLCRQAGIRAYPTVRLYAGGVGSGKSQGYYGEEVDAHDADQIIRMLQRKLGTKKAVKTKDEL